MKQQQHRAHEIKTSNKKIVVSNLAALELIKPKQGLVAYVENVDGEFVCDGRKFDHHFYGLSSASKADRTYEWLRRYSGKITPEMFEGDHLTQLRQAVHTGESINLERNKVYTLKQIDYSKHHGTNPEAEGIIYLSDNQTIHGNGATLIHDKFNKPIFSVPNKNNVRFENLTTFFKGFRGMHRQVPAVGNLITDGGAQHGYRTWLTIYAQAQCELFGYGYGGHYLAPGFCVFAINGSDGITFDNVEISTHPDQRNQFECLYGCITVTNRFGDDQFEETMTRNMLLKDVTMRGFYMGMRSCNIEGLKIQNLHAHEYVVFPKTSSYVDSIYGGTVVNTTNDGPGHVIYHNKGKDWEVDITDHGICMGKHVPGDGATADHNTFKAHEVSNVNGKITSKRPHGAVFMRFCPHSDVRFESDMTTGGDDNHTFDHGYTGNIIRDGSSDSHFVLDIKLPDMDLTGKHTFMVPCGNPEVDAANMNVEILVDSPRNPGMYRFDTYNSSLKVGIKNAVPVDTTYDLGTVGGYGGSGSNVKFDLFNVENPYFRDYTDLNTVSFNKMASADEVEQVSNLS